MHNKLNFEILFAYIGSIILIVSNLFGLIPLQELLIRDLHCGAVLLIVAMVSSMLMNVSDTSHHLPGLCFQKKHVILKTVDSVTAKVIVVYCVYAIIHNPNKSLLQVIMALSSLVFLNLINLAKASCTYVLVYTIFHACAYGFIYVAII